MNIFSKKQAICNLLLIATLLSPGLLLAQPDSSGGGGTTTGGGSGGGTTTGGDTTGGGAAAGGSDSGGGDPATETTLQQILLKHDISSKEMVTALINYMAASSIQNYGLEEQKLFQVAPGSLWASQAGSEAGVLNFEKLALNITNLSMINSLGILSDQTQITVGDATVDFTTTPAYGALELYRSMSGFFVGGDTTQLKSINAGALLQAKTIVEAGFTPADAQKLVNLLTNPFPVHDNEITTKLKSGTAIDGAEMEQLGQLLAQYAVIGVSANAWADIVARRSPPTDTSGAPVADGKTVMEIMEKTSKDRFTSKEWYAAIGTASEAALLRELVHMTAYNQWVQYQQFRMSEQQVSLLASLNAIMAKVNSGIDMMNGELTKAKAEAELQAKNAQRQVEEQKAAAEQQARDLQSGGGTSSSSGSSTSSGN